ncbi:hypothetical protein Cde04nite_19510 [Cellulomonas denverensis]|nr:hypothetical protein Cde04nite_19510 [Cellulomonas denverensis]
MAIHARVVRALDAGVVAVPPLVAQRNLGASPDRPAQPVFRPIRHAWRVEVAHGRLGRSRRLAKSFENATVSATGWLQVACIATTLRHLSRTPAHRRALTLAA